MKIRNREIEHLGRLLYELSLKGKVSRMRTRFVNILETHLQNVIIREQIELLQQYSKKNENGDMLQDENGAIILEKDMSKEYHQEYDLLMDEHFHIDLSDANKLMILSVAQLMLDGDFEVSGEVAEMYDMWCEVFEEAIDIYESREKEQL